MRKVLRRLIGDDGGAVAPLVGLSLFALIACGGIAFDYARMAAMDTELQNAADQAALAAASQLDGESGACERAVAAALNLVANSSLFANDGSGPAVTLSDPGICNDDGTIAGFDGDTPIRFYQDKAATTPSTSDANARFVDVTVDSRRANFALTPIVAAFTSGDLAASARAGLGTALCKVPPLMICNPFGDGAEVDWDAMRGKGLRAVAQTWTPGGFGYIGPQDANSTQIGLAFQDPVFQCQEINTTLPVSTGGPAPAIAAVNTRFDIYDMGGGGGQALSPCLNGACPAAVNVTKDVVRAGNASGNNACKIHTNGWELPASGRRFRPVPAAGTDPMRSFQTASQPIDAMGLPRDNCHYTSFSSGAGGYTCPSSNHRFGDGAWARGDYFNKYHSGRIPADAGTMSRYDTYLWEITNGYIPNQIASGSGANALWQHGSPVCSTGTPDPTRDRRVLQVAVGDNCSQLHGASVPVEIGSWIEVFFVEPGLPNPGRGNGDSGNEIYLEIIRKVNPGGDAAQVIRRDVPYLVR